MSILEFDDTHQKLYLCTKQVCPHAPPTQAGQHIGV